MWSIQRANRAKPLRPRLRCVVEEGSRFVWGDDGEMPGIFCRPLEAVVVEDLGERQEHRRRGEQSPSVALVDSIIAGEQPRRLRPRHPPRQSGSRTGSSTKPDVLTGHAAYAVEAGCRWAAERGARSGVQLRRHRPALERHGVLNRSQHAGQHLLVRATSKRPADRPGGEAGGEHLLLGDQTVLGEQERGDLGAVVHHLPGAS